MKVTAIIQARISSSRLPGKVLLKAAEAPLLQHMIERVRHSKLSSEVVVATSVCLVDNPIEALCQELRIPCFRGSEADVLDRFYLCALTRKADVIVRLTADDPLQEPEVMDKVIHLYLEHFPKYDYVSNTINPTYPDGFDTEVFSMKALREAWEDAKLPSEREHVTTYIKKNSSRFACLNVADSVDRSKLCWAIDNDKDYQVIKTVIEGLSHIKPYFNYQDILSFFQQNPYVAKINAASNSDIGYLKSIEEDRKFLANNQVTKKELTQ